MGTNCAPLVVDFFLFCCKFTSLFSHAESFTDETCNTKEKKANLEQNINKSCILS